MTLVENFIFCISSVYPMYMDWKRYGMLPNGIVMTPISNEGECDGIDLKL